MIRYNAFYYVVRKDGGLYLDYYNSESNQFMFNLVRKYDRIKLYQDSKNTCIKIKESCSNHFSDVCEVEV